VKKRYLRVAYSGARRLVDQAHAGGAQLVERRRDVVDPVRDVVQPGAASREKAPDGRVLGQRRQQLDMAVTDVEQRRLDALLGDRLAVDERHPVPVAVHGDRRVEVLHGDADVVDAPEHGGECTLTPVRIALAANRASGGGLDPEPLAAAMRDRGADVGVFGCRDEDLERAAEWGPERLAVAGGDGTIGPVAELAGRLGVPLAVLPTGTANDFARAFGVPSDRRAAGDLAATGEHTRPLELGRLADGRPFVNVASAGLASVAARNARPLKPRLGPLAYGVGALRAAAREHPLRVLVRADGRTVFEGECWQVIVAVSGAFGAGSGVAEADPDDGVLDAVILPAGSRAGLARRAWGLRTRTIAQQHDVPHERGKVVEVDLPHGSEINVDGELRLGGLERVTVTPGAFRLVVPEPAS
jgi:diacylglycerol kinase (ATP)